MKGLLVTLSSDFIGDMVRFGYRKITLVSPMEGGRRGASQRQESNEDILSTWIKAGYREKGTPTLSLPPPGQLDIILTHREQLKLTLECEKGKDKLKDPPTLPAQQHQSPKVSHPSSSGAHPSHRQERRHPGSQRSTQKQQRGKVHYRAQHLCLAAAKHPPCVHAAVA